MAYGPSLRAGIAKSDVFELKAALNRIWKTSRVCRGQDFRLYPAITEALKFFKEAGKDTVLARSKHLGAYLQEKMDELFSTHGIDHVFLNDICESPVIAIAFTDYDPYHLYKYLNEQQVHIKCIKDHKIAGTIYHILRIGIPYFETSERLNYVLFEMGRYLSENKTVARKELVMKQA